MSFDRRYRESVSTESDPESVLALTAKLDAEKEQIKAKQEEELKK